MKKVIFIAMLVVSLTCVWGKPKKKSAEPQKASAPEWVMSPQAVYPAAKYFCAVGEGRNRSQAENAAVANLASIFSQDVSQKTTSQKAIDSKGTSFAALQMASTKVTNIKDLIGAEIKGTYQDGANWSAIAVMDKQAAATMYRSAIEKNDVDVKNIMTQAAEVDYSMDTFLAVSKAYQMAQKNELLLERLAVLNANLAAQVRKTVTTSSEVFALFSEISAAIPISIACDNDKYKAALKGAMSGLGVQIADADTERYSLAVDTIFQNIATRDGKSVNSNWELTVSLKDGSTAIYTYNKSGRSAGLDEELAQLKADGALVNVLKGDFIKDFTNYLMGSAK